MGVNSGPLARGRKRVLEHTAGHRAPTVQSGPGKLVGRGWWTVLPGRKAGCSQTWGTCCLDGWLLECTTRSVRVCGQREAIEPGSA